MCMFLNKRSPPIYTRTYTLFPYPSLFRSIARGQDRVDAGQRHGYPGERCNPRPLAEEKIGEQDDDDRQSRLQQEGVDRRGRAQADIDERVEGGDAYRREQDDHAPVAKQRRPVPAQRSEEHTSEPQSLLRNSYAVLCLKKKKNKLKQD